MISEIDTGKASLIHKLFPSHPNRKISIYTHYFIPYISTAIATFGLLTIFAVISLPSMTVRSSSLKLPFLYDFNTICMFLITLPFLVALLVTERITIPKGLEKIIESGVLKISNKDSKILKEKWENIYRLINIAGQIIGAIIGYLVSLANYNIVIQPGHGSWSALGNHVYLAGWYFFICFFFLYFIVTLYFSRNFTTIFLLRDIIKYSKMSLIPFHPDKSGGLKPIGILGLRNQYVLSIIGINFLGFYNSYLFLSSDPQLKTLLIIGIVVYIIVGPISFMGPLLPFRNAMEEDKNQVISLVASGITLEFNKMKGKILNGSITEEDETKIFRYKKIGELAENLPVWPFDTTTLRKFFSAYIIPLGTMIYTLFQEKIIQILKQLLNL